jgi:medium-chain acyl-[acyl-carrier-protein] hydrolase
MNSTMSNSGTTTNPWLPNVRLNPRAALRLFAFPYAGGSTAIYRNWQAALPEGIDLCPVQLPGRGSRMREQSFTRVPALVESLAEALRPHLDRPFAFFGHSMGAAIGFELARRLRERYSLEPAHLFVSGRRAPQVPGERLHTYDLPEEEFVAELQRLNGTPRDVLLHAELMQVMLPLLRADFELIQTYEYVPGPPLGCPVSAFGGLQDYEVERGMLEAWREHTEGPFSVHMLPGDHFFLHSAGQQLLRLLAQKLYPHRAR